MACNKCKVAKGKCFKGKLAKDSPVLRSPGGIAARQLAQEKLASKKAYEAGKLHKKQIEELKKENEKLEGKLESLGSAERASGDDAKEVGFKGKLSVLERKKVFFEEFGMAEDLARTLAEIKELRASKEAGVPDGHQLRKAEQDLAKRKRQSLVSKAAMAEARKNLEELEKKDQEADQRLTEAEVECERVRTRIAATKSTQSCGTASSVAWGEIAKGHKEYLELVPLELLEQHGLGSDQQQILATLLGNLAALQAATAERRDAEKAHAAAAERAQKEPESSQQRAQPAAIPVPMDATAVPAGRGTISGAHAELAKSFDDELMGLCKSPNQEMAETARKLVEQRRSLEDAEAKRRKVESSSAKV